MYAEQLQERTNDSSPETKKIKKRSLILWSALVVWGCGMLIVVASLMVSHWYSLPVPDGDDPALAKAIDQTRSVNEMGQWYAVHFLYGQCGCSERILDHIVSRRSHPEVREKIIFVDKNEDWQQRAAKAGVAFEVIEHVELKQRFNIEAAPLLVVAGPDAKTYYAGGYTDRKRSIDIADYEIMDSLVSNNPVKTIPLFGCAVAKSLQTILDPLGIKY